MNYVSVCFVSFFVCITLNRSFINCTHARTARALVYVLHVFFFASICVCLRFFVFVSSYTAEMRTFQYFNLLRLNLSRMH